MLEKRKPLRVDACSFSDPDRGFTTFQPHDRCVGQVRGAAAEIPTVAMTPE